MPKPPEPQDIPRILVEAREAAGLTQERAGQLVGVSSMTVSRWERGDRVPNAPTLRGVLDAYERHRIGQGARPMVPRGTDDARPRASPPEGRSAHTASFAAGWDAAIRYVMELVQQAAPLGGAEASGYVPYTDPEEEVAPPRPTATKRRRSSGGSR